MKTLYKVAVLVLFPISTFSQYFELLGEGDTDFMLKDYKSAILNYNKAEAEAELDLYALFMRGLSKTFLAEYESAIVDFSKIVERKPLLKNELWTFGTRRKKVGNTYVESPSGTSLWYYYIDVWFYRGLSKFHLSDFRGAISDFNNYIELEKNNSDVYNYRALSKFELKKFDDAITDFSQAIKLNNKIGLLFYNRGAAYFNIGKSEEGCLGMSKAGEFGYSQAYKIIKENCK